MSGPNRRLRPGALVAPLTLVAAAASLVPIAAGAHLVTEGDGPPITQVVVSNTSAVHGYYPWPTLKAPAAPAARQRKPPQRQPQAPQHPRRHRPASKRHRPARPKHPSKHTERPQVHQQPHIPALMLLDHAVLDIRAAGASPSLLNFVNRPQDLVSTSRARVKPLKDATRIQVFSSYVTIAHAIARHHIAADTRAVVYDNEHSTGTPAAELANPLRYC